MKTIGAGVAAGTALTGLAAAGEDSNGETDSLDPLWGHAGIAEDMEAGFPAPEDFPSEIRPDHVVALHVDEEFHTLHFHPTGLHIQPGDVVMFTLPTPDHSVTAYHERIRGGMRVPEGVGPFSSPVLPAGGYWLYRFDEAGVYDLFCAPHEFMGMVMRIVAHDGEGEAPAGHGNARGPTPFHIFNYLKELGLDDENPPFTYPSSLDALTSDALDPANILENGSVHYLEVFEEFNPELC